MSVSKTVHHPIKTKAKEKYTIAILLVPIILISITIAVVVIDLSAIKAGTQADIIAARYCKHYGDQYNQKIKYFGLFNKKASSWISYPDKLNFVCLAKNGKMNEYVETILIKELP